MTYTGDDVPDDARLTGRIPAILADVADDLSGTSVFIAGTPDFVTDCATAAAALGAAPDRLFVERYTPAS